MFSNLITSIPNSKQLANPATSSSSLKKNPIQPFMESSQPHANQTNILTSFQNSLTPQKTDIWFENPITVAKPHAHDTPGHISTSVDRLETQMSAT
jgi:hypothetical protein